MSFMKIGGKTASNTAVGVQVASDGAVVAQKEWNNQVINLYTSSGNLTTGTYKPDALDISTYGAVSLRIRNTTGVDMTIGFYKEGTNVYLRDYDGNLIQISISGSLNGWTMVTPNDIDALQWLSQLAISFTMDEATSSGSVIIDVVTKG